MSRDFLPIKSGYMHRPRLNALLEKGLDFPLISVIAGPGYGKTLAVAGFVEKLPRRLIWQRLQKTDNDAMGFWMHFTEAVRRELPGLADDLSKLFLPSALGECDIIIRMFSEESLNGPPIFLVLDEIENISNPQVISFLEILLSSELENLCIALVSSEKQPAIGAVPTVRQFRITMEDLQFNAEEIALLFSMYGITLLPAEIEQAAADTGGWPLALHLMCFHHTGSDRDILQEHSHLLLASELFQRHYYANLSEEMRQLLVRLSFFDSFPLALVEKLAKSDIDRTVNELSGNVFIEYNFTEQLFQFQNMYRSFLSHRQALVPADEVEALYSFMGQWLLEHGYLFEALDCFWHNRDYDNYLLAVSSLPRCRKGVNTTSQILERLVQFPKTYASEHPELEFSIAVLLLNALQTNQANEMLLALAKRLVKETPTKQTRLLLGDVYVVLADISLLRNTDEGLAYMKRAIEYLPKGCRIRTRESMLIGNNYAFFLPNGEPGQLQRMAKYFFEYALYADIVTNGSGYGYEWLFAAQAAFLSENLDKARENCFQAITKAKITDQHDIICNAWWDLVRIGLYNGDYQQARHWLDELSQYVDSHRIAELYELRDCAESWFHIRVGDLDKVAPWVSAVAPIQTDHILEVGRNRIIIIYYLSVQGRHGEAFAEITRLESALHRKGGWHERILLYVHKAARLLEGGDRAEALSAFKTAYDMVYGNRIAAIFAEFGKIMQRIIRLALAQEEIAFDREWLDTVYRKAGSFEKRSTAMLKAYQYKNQSMNKNQYGLNRREKEILQYMAQGMTRNEISQHLNTSLSNIKRYINNIYTKLGALNRADAIHIATLNGIIEMLE